MFLKIALASLLILSNVFGEYKNIIFDLGGVILEGSAIYYIKEHLKKPELEFLTKSNLWKSWDRGLIRYEELFAGLLQMDCKLEDINNIMALDLNPNRGYIDETVNVIHKLKKQNYKLYLLSNLTYDHHELYIKNNKLFELFDGMIFSCHVGSRKPEEEIYKALLNTYNLIPGESIFIDDMEENIAAALRLGITGIVYKTGTLVDELTKLDIKM